MSEKREKEKEERKKREREKPACGAEPSRDATSSTASLAAQVNERSKDRWAGRHGTRGEEIESRLRNDLLNRPPRAPTAAAAAQAPGYALRRALTRRDAIRRRQRRGEDKLLCTRHSLFSSLLFCSLVRPSGRPSGSLNRRVHRIARSELCTTNTLAYTCKASAP